MMEGPMKLFTFFAFALLASLVTLRSFDSTRSTPPTHDEGHPVVQLHSDAHESIVEPRRLSDEIIQNFDRRRLQKKKAMKNAVPSGFQSPHNGTDILSHPIALIRCNNQTQCIQPKFQLEKTFDVYFCNHVGNGVRFYFLVREGLLLHPNIRLVSDPDKADAVVYLPVSAPWEKTECNNPVYREKTIVLDESDGPHLFEPQDGERTKWLLYFKRSCEIRFFAAKCLITHVAPDLHKTYNEEGGCSKDTWATYSAATFCR